MKAGMTVEGTDDGKIVMTLRTMHLAERHRSKTTISQAMLDPRFREGAKHADVVWMEHRGHTFILKGTEVIAKDKV